MEVISFEDEKGDTIFSMRKVKDHDL